MGLHDDDLVDMDLIPLINTAWKSSFAHIDKNKNALADRGWNPLNQNLLLHDDLRATMTRKEKSAEYHLSNDIIIPRKFKSSEASLTATEASSSTTSPSNHPSIDTGSDQSSPSTIAKPGDELNFSSGESLQYLKAMFNQDQWHAARERICEDNMNDGKTIKEQLKANSRLSAGILFKTGTNRLGKTVFDICRDNQQEKKQKSIDKMKKDENEYIKNVENAMKVWKKKGNVNNMTIRELTIVIKPFKQKSYGKMPNKKEELIAKYNEWVDRPTPVFNYDDIDDNIVELVHDVLVVNGDNNNDDIAKVVNMSEVEL